MAANWNSQHDLFAHIYLLVTNQYLWYYGYLSLHCAYLEYRNIFSYQRYLSIIKMNLLRSQYKRSEQLFLSCQNSPNLFRSYLTFRVQLKEHRLNCNQTVPYH